MSTILKIVPELKNMLINGNFDFWQRGTSFTPASSGAYSADRMWSSFLTGTFGSNETITRAADVPTVAQSGFQSNYSFKVTNGTSKTQTTNEYLQFGFPLEGLDYLQIHGAKNVRLQFWVKSSVTGTYAVNFQNWAGSRNYVNTYTVVAANTWERKTIDILTDNAGTWAFDNTGAIAIWFNLVSGTNYNNATLNQWNGGSFGTNSQTNWAGTAGATFQLAQVALYPIAAGSGVTLPFNRAGRTIGDELRLCQRYCYVFDGDVDTVLGYGQARTTTDNEVLVNFPVTMRATPSLESGTSAATGANYRVSNAADNSIPSATGITLQSGCPKNTMLAFSGASGLVAGNASKTILNAGVKVIFGAEL